MTLEERAAINAKIERLWNTSPAVADGVERTKADWTKFARERTRLFNKLGRGCRYCGNPAPGFFMLQGDLWPKVVGVEPGRRCYGAGWVCLACCAERLFPRQLYDTDFGVDGRDQDEEGNYLNRLFLEQRDEDPAGYSYTVHGTLAFPEVGDP